jgi:hypothetical protein
LIIYDKFFQKTKAQELVVTVGYFFPGIITAAKSLNIETIELQHGAFSRYHLGYSDNPAKPSPFNSSKMIVWNDFWAEKLRDVSTMLPIISYPILLRQNIEKNRFRKKVTDQVVILSQKPIQKQLFSFLKGNWSFLENKKVMVKLHPSEYRDWQNNIDILEISKKSNVTILTDVDLHQVLSESEYQIGVYSTALYEGLEYGLKTIILKLQFHEYMEELICSSVVSTDLDILCKRL